MPPDIAKCSLGSKITPSQEPLPRGILKLENSEPIGPTEFFSALDKLSIQLSTVLS